MASCICVAARYEGPLLEEDLFHTALEHGPASSDFTRLVEWLTTQLAGHAGLEDHVNAISDPSDADTFLMELSGFLREYGKPGHKLVVSPCFLYDRHLS